MMPAHRSSWCDLIIIRIWTIPLASSPQETGLEIPFSEYMVACLMGYSFTEAGSPNLDYSFINYLFLVNSQFTSYCHRRGHVGGLQSHFMHVPLLPFTVCLTTITI